MIIFEQNKRQIINSNIRNITNNKDIAVIIVVDLRVRVQECCSKMSV